MIALVGLGYWGEKLLRGLVSLVGPSRVMAVDQDPARLVWASRHHPSVSCRSGLDNALADPAVEAVILATPITCHAEQAAAALAANRHVLVEKPLTTDTGHAVALAELAERVGRVLMVGHTFLFSPRVRWLHQRLTTTGIGDVRYVMSSRLNLGRHQPATNVIWDLAPHDFSIVLHLLKEHPLTASTSARGILHQERPDVAFIDLTFPSGIIASVTVSWLAPRKVRSMVVVGDESMIVYDDLEPDEPVKVHDKGVILDMSTGTGTHQQAYRYGDTVAPHIAAREPIVDQLAHFLACVGSGKRPLSDGWFGARVVAALAAAEESWRADGIPVPVRDVP
ncbi:Gfo/Idh/MocA family protein [Actinophytocola sediminis]